MKLEWSIYYMYWDLFGDVGIHHKIVDVFFCSGKLQLPGNHGNHQHCAASPLQCITRQDRKKHGDQTVVLKIHK